MHAYLVTLIDIWKAEWKFTSRSVIFTKFGRISYRENPNSCPMVQIFQIWPHVRNIPWRVYIIMWKDLCQLVHGLKLPPGTPVCRQEIIPCSPKDLGNWNYIYMSSIAQCIRIIYFKRHVRNTRKRISNTSHFHLFQFLRVSL